MLHHQVHLRLAAGIIVWQRDSYAAVAPVGRCRQEPFAQLRHIDIQIHQIEVASASLLETDIQHIVRRPFHRSHLHRRHIADAQPQCAVIHLQLAVGIAESMLVRLDKQVVRGHVHRTGRIAHRRVHRPAHLRRQLHFLLEHLAVRHLRRRPRIGHPRLVHPQAPHPVPHISHGRPQPPAETSHITT